MQIISHRGNLNGPNPETENTVEAITKALDKGFDVEIDVWYLGDKFWLGHDCPQRSFTLDMLDGWSKKGSVYVHCKNLWAMQYYMEDYGFKFRPVFPFMHDYDQAVLLHNGYIWVHPNALGSVDNRMLKRCIAVSPDAKTIKYQIDIDFSLEKWYGVCTDYPEEVRNNL